MTKQILLAISVVCANVVVGCALCPLSAADYSTEANVWIEIAFQAQRVHTDPFNDLTFTVIQLVAGLYPDMPAFDERGRNEAGFPWEMNYARIHPDYFDAADRRVQYLVDQGFVACIVGAWGYHLPWLGTDTVLSTDAHQTIIVSPPHDGHQDWVVVVQCP